MMGAKEKHVVGEEVEKDKCKDAPREKKNHVGGPNAPDFIQPIKSGQIVDVVNQLQLPNSTLIEKDIRLG